MAQRIGELDRIFHGKLGARADRKVCRMRRVADQHDVLMMPLAAENAIEVEPRRAAQVAGIAHQLVAIEILAEYALAKRDRARLVGLVEAGGQPILLARLNDEGAGVGIETVGVELEPTPFRLFEGEGEGIEPLVRAEPDIATFARLDVGLKSVGIFLPHEAVDAVGGDDQVAIGEGRVIRHLGLELLSYAEGGGAGLQDVEQLLPRDAAKPVPAGGDLATLEVDVDIVPMMKIAQDRRVALGIGVREVGQGRIREHHAPTECVVRPIAFDHGDVMSGIGPLHQNGEIEAGRLRRRHTRCALVHASQVRLLDI